MSTRDELAEIMDLCFEASNDVDHMAAAVLAHLAERGMVVLGPDGEPIDVRPALRALELISRTSKSHHPEDPVYVLMCAGITGPLADACLAAAEVGP